MNMLLPIGVGVLVWWLASGSKKSSAKNEKDEKDDLPQIESDMPGVPITGNATIGAEGIIDRSIPKPPGALTLVPMKRTKVASAVDQQSDADTAAGLPIIR